MERHGKSLFRERPGQLAGLVHVVPDAHGLVDPARHNERLSHADVETKDRAIVKRRKDVV